MDKRRSEWIAAVGLRAVEADASAVGVPEDILAAHSLSLKAKGLYALVLAQQGQPIDPYDDAFEAEPDVGRAIDELVIAGLVIRVDP